MGKKIIIKGADFSTNGIYHPIDYLLVIAQMPVEKGSINQITGENSDDSRHVRLTRVETNPTNSTIRLTLKPSLSSDGYQASFYLGATFTTWVTTTDVAGEGVFRFKIQRLVDGVGVDVPILGDGTLGDYFNVTYAG